MRTHDGVNIAKTKKLDERDKARVKNVRENEIVARLFENPRSMNSKFNPNMSNKGMFIRVLRQNLGSEAFVFRINRACLVARSIFPF